MSTAQVSNELALQRYYRLHAKIYDATRWSFLFGRKKIIHLASDKVQPKNILEVGCGTGSNIRALISAFPKANITGLDLSAAMLEVANKKISNTNEQIKLIEKKYDQPLMNIDGKVEKFDLILFSYALSMFNPGWDAAIKAAKEQLSEDGMIAVVDFQKSRFKSYKNWMKINHVKMEDHLNDELKKHFIPMVELSRNAYFGIWDYLLFVGKRL